MIVLAPVQEFRGKCGFIIVILAKEDSFTFRSLTNHIKGSEKDVSEPKAGHASTDGAHQDLAS